MPHHFHETRSDGLRTLDYLAAALIGAGGYLHYCLYHNGYRTIPTIGTGFLVQFVSSAVLAVALIVPLGFAVRVGPVALGASTVRRLAGIGLAAGTLVAFGLSRLPGGLFNFEERGLQPAPQSLLTLVTEGATVVLLLAALVLDGMRRHARSALMAGVRPSPRHRASV